MKKITSILISILACTTIFAQESKDSMTFTQFSHQFTFGKFSHNEIIFPYRQAEICQNAEGKNALVIFLHSSSYRGTDNFGQIKSYATRNIYNYLKNNNIKSTIIAPQCDKNHFWNDYDSKTSTALKAMIDSIVSNNLNIDKSRIYIFGASTGGAGVWRMISDYPETFAGAMLVAAYPRNVYVSNLAKTPLCCVIGSKDKVASKTSVRPTVKEMQKKGGKVKFEILKGSDHQSACRDAFTTENLKWVFENTK